MRTHVIYLLGLFLLTGVIFILEKRLSKSEREADGLASSLVEKQAEIQYRIDREGRIVALKDAAELYAKEIGRAYPEVLKQLNELKIEQKNMKAYIRNEFEARSSGNSVINNYTYTDSLGKKYPYWELKASDGYFDFRAKVYDSLNAPYTHTYRDTATTVVHTKKKWPVFGKEQLFATTRFENPNAKITGTTNILVKDYKDKRFSVNVGISYVPFLPVEKPIEKFQPTIGVGYSLFKF